MKFECLSSDCSCCNSDHIFSTQLINHFVEDVTSKKKTMVLAMESVMRLMREVEYEENAAEIAKEEAEQCSFEILAMVDEIKQAKQRAKETNDMLAREVYVQKDLLATESDVLQLQVAHLLDNGDRSLDLLNEMHTALKKRLTLALLAKELANKNKQQYIGSVRAALSYEKIQMKKVEKEYKRLKQEAAEISKLQEFLIDRGHVIDMLRGEISDKCQDVKLLKDELDQAILHGGITSVLASSSSSSVSSMVHCQPHTQIKSVESRANEVFETDIKISKFVEGITRSFKIWKVKGELRGKGMFARSIRKVKIKGKLYGSLLFAKRVEKLKVKGKLCGNRICTKSIKKVKIKGKLYRNRMCANSRKKVNVKDKLHGSRVCSKSTKKAKINAKICVTRMFAKRIKEGELNGKLHESRLFAKSIKKVKIKVQSASKSNVCLKNQLVNIKVCEQYLKKVQLRANHRAWF